MRILAVATNFDRCEAHMLAGLANKGLEITVLTTSAEKFTPILEAAGIKVFPIALPSRMSLRAIKTIRRILISEKIDLMHCFSNRALSNGLLAAIGLNVRCVAYRGTIGHLSRWDPLSWMTYLNPRVSAIVCASKAVKNYLKQFLPEDKLYAIYKGHDAKWYAPKKAMQRSDFGLSQNQIVIGCVANMRPVKGVSYLIEAVNRLPTDLPVVLLLLGRLKDSSVQALIDSSRIAGRIRHLGFQEDVGAILNLCDIFVMPSIAREGLPKALVEAMSQGLAPIVTDVGGMPEIVENEVNGLVIPPKDVRCIRQALEQLIASEALRQELGQKAKLMVEQHLTLDRVVLQVEALYRSLLKDQPQSNHREAQLLS